MKMHCRPTKFFKHMIRALGFICLAVLVVPSQPSQPQGPSPDRPIDWVFLVDTSKSMIGAGGTANIFDDVKRAVKNFIQSTNKTDSVTLYTFDSRVDGSGSAYIISQSDKDILFNKVDDLAAEGLFTHTGEAVQAGLNRQKELQSPPDPNRGVCIILLTDGLEDTRDKPSARRVEDIEVPPRELRPYAIFVWLGKDLQEFARSPLNTLKERFGEQGKVLFYPEAKEIDNFVKDVRGFLPPSLLITTTSLDFGSVEPGSVTETQTLRVQSNRQTSISLNLTGIESADIWIAEPDQTVGIKAGDNEVEVALGTSSNIREGLKKAKLQVSVKEIKLDLSKKDSDSQLMSVDVPVEVTVARVSVWVKLVKWGGLSVALLLMVLTGLCIRYDTTPKGLYQLWKSRKNLEGEIEIKNSYKPEESMLVSLANQNVQGLRLSQIEKLPPNPGGDAELLAYREDGEKGVRLQQAEGMVRVNGEPVSPESIIPLYNEDQIQVGESLSLIYRGPRERPY